MTPFTIHFPDNKRHFLPGETVEGRFNWHLSEAPHTLEIRLVWFTQGKGTPDREVVAKKELGAAGAVGDARFAFELPLAPHSFSGALISLCWAIEAASLKPPALIRLGSNDQTAERAEFVLGWAPREIELAVVDVPQPQSAFAARKAAYWAKKSPAPFQNESPWSDPPK